MTTPGGLENPIAVVVSDDNEPPILEHEPVERAVAGRGLTILTRASDRSGVEYVRLRYRRLCQFDDYEAITMVFDGDAYKATIPGDFVQPEWDLVYFFESMDRCGNGVNYPDFEQETPYFIVQVRQSNG